MKAHLHEGAFHAFMKGRKLCGNRDIKPHAIAKEYKVEKSDAKEYKYAHRDFSANWKATVEVTGMVAQRRAKQGHL